MATTDKSTTVQLSFNFSNVDSDAYLSGDLEIVVESIDYLIDIFYDGDGNILKKVSTNGGSSWTTLSDSATSYSTSVAFSTYEDEWDYVKADANITGVAEDDGALVKL